MPHGSLTMNAAAMQLPVALLSVTALTPLPPRRLRLKVVHARQLRETEVGEYREVVLLGDGVRP